MDIEYIMPDQIENRSFEILTDELKSMGIELTGDTAPVIKRCIHTSADFDYAKTLKFSKDAVSILKELFKKKTCIVTDTNMALAGINKAKLSKYGIEAKCFMADDDVAIKAKERHVTRASVSMEKAMQMSDEIIFVIGNAPTALITLNEAYKKGIYKPAFIIGVPVGFVNVEAAKELILNSDITYIVNKGRKGGSNIAAAICNAVLNME